MVRRLPRFMLRRSSLRGQSKWRLKRNSATHQGPRSDSCIPAAGSGFTWVAPSFLGPSLRAQRLQREAPMSLLSGLPRSRGVCPSRSPLQLDKSRQRPMPEFESVPGVSGSAGAFDVMIAAHAEALGPTLGYLAPRIWKMKRDVGS
jgi:hypothetical protein